MDDETTRLRALLKGIALPWKAQPTVVDGDEVECLALVLCPHGDDGDRDMVAEIDMGHGVECDDAHAALIVAAVNALPGLLDSAERAGRELATATASVRQLRADVELATGQRDAEACRADNAEAERDDLAATLETRTAEHALAMARVRELEYVLRAACDFFGAAWGSDACLRCGATRGHEAHGHGCIIGRMERTLPPAAEVSR